MKKIITTFCLLILTISTLKAQSYFFSTLNATYQDLSSPTLVSSPDWNDFSVFKVKLPFKFNYFGKSYDTIYAMGGFDGFVYETDGKNQFFPSDQIYTFDNGMVDSQNNESTISYQTTGSIPNRIFKLQTKNAHFSEDATATDYANVQLWLYETSNVIEIHYGTSSILNSETWQVPDTKGPSIGIFNTNTNYVSLSGNADNPTVSSTEISMSIDGVPSINKVFRFNPKKVGLSMLSSLNTFSMFPNPTSGMITIQHAEGKNLQIIDLYGKEIVRKDQLVSDSKIQLEGILNAGIYFVNIFNQSGEIVESAKLVFN